MASSTRNLRKYHSKRNFKDTPEPKGRIERRGRTYVVQKHDATRLHYDLRLEHRGVLLSWAVPKQPSLEPGVKRLAVRVEDHPLDYATFEGEIPKGNYGAGTVEIWDEGTWSTEDDVDAALDKGHLGFNIEGERLHGAYDLVRMGPASEKENWLLIKHKDEQDPTEAFVVLGFVPYASKKSVKSLLVGRARNGELVYGGKVGAGLDSATREDLFQRLGELRQSKPHVKGIEAKDSKGAIWVKPEMLVRVRVLKQSDDGLIRQARFAGVVEMANEPSQPEQPQFKVTSGDRVVDKATGTTKQGVADFYQVVLPRLFPHLQNRLISVIRCPGGVQDECFFQRHPKAKIDGIKGVPVGDDVYMGLVKPEGVLGLVQFGGIEFHPWGSSIKDVSLPDRLIFDLDPGPDVEWKRVCEAARLVKKILADLGLKPFLKISGGKGLHVVCAIKPELDWPKVKAFSKTLVESMAKEHPDEFVSKMTKSIRNEKIYVDYLRNDHAATAVAPYSLRARDGFAVAWPITWEQLDEFKNAHSITVENYRSWLDQPDPWEGIGKTAVSLKKILKL